MKQEITVIQKILGLCFLLTALTTSCSQNKPVRENISEKEDTIQPPVRVPAAKPRLIRLDTCPPPVTIPVQAKSALPYKVRTNEGVTTVALPPKTRPADFIVPTQSYNSSNGLAYSSVSCICQDKKGNIWFGTPGGGVSCYDGKSFRNFTMAQGLKSNVVNCILEDKKGNIWIGSWLGGISCYNGRSFKNYSGYEGLVDDRVISMLEDRNGVIWIGTAFGNGISSFDGRSFTNYSTKEGLIDNTVTSIFEDKSGSLWFGTENGLSCFDKKSFKNYTAKVGLVNNYITCISEDASGALWFGTTKGLSRFDGKSFRNFTTANGLPEDFVTSLMKKRNGQFLVRTQNSLSLYNDNSFLKINTPVGHSGTSYGKSMLEDKNGNLWFGNSSGVSRYDGNFLSFLSNYVSSIDEDKAGNLWFANPSALVSRYNGNSFTHYSFPEGLQHNTLLLSDKRGNLWIGGSDKGGVYQLDSAGRLLKYYGTAQGVPECCAGLLCMLEDSKGNLWFGPDGAEGVWQFDKERKSFAIYKEGLVFPTLTCMLEDKKGNLWFGSWHGISRLDSEKNFFTNFSIGQGLSHDEVRAICEDRNGHLWFGTKRGACRYDGKSFLNFTTDEGMANDEVSAIVEDTSGIIWIGTKLGFCSLKFKPRNEGSQTATIEADNTLGNNELKTNYEPLFEFYNYRTGFPVKNVNWNAMYVDSKGILWTGTGDRLIRFDYNRKYKDPNPPNVFIQSVKINNENISWYDLSKENEKPDSITVPSNITEETMVFGKKLNEADRSSLRKKYSDVRFDSITGLYPVPVNLTLPYSKNNIAFDFAAIEPARPNLVRYQYILEGYDKQWSPVTDKSTAIFGNIHEGSYSFKLKAQNPDGVWSEPVTYTFRVLPPWYRAWWAYALYVLLFLTALFSFIRWRIRSLKNEKIILEEKVSLRTYELKEEKEKVEKTLTELKNTQSQLIQSEKMASLGELTAGIAHEIQNPLNFVNNFSEVNGELISELVDEVDKGNYDEVRIIAVSLKDNEEKIIHHGKRADAIVKGMLQHSKTSTGIKEPTGINALCDEYLRLAYHGMRAKDKSFNADFATDFDNSIGKINVVPQDIGRVLLNLFNNAFYAVNEKFTANRSPLTADYKPTVSVQTKRINFPSGDGDVEIIVTDNGNGISPNIVDKIFQPFFTTKPTGQGTGLGLSLAYDIIKAHSGEIKVETKAGEGSEFVVQLPVT